MELAMLPHPNAATHQRQSQERTNIIATVVPDHSNLPLPIHGLDTGRSPSSHNTTSIYQIFVLLDSMLVVLSEIMAVSTTSDLFQRSSPKSHLGRSGMLPLVGSSFPRCDPVTPAEMDGCGGPNDGIASCTSCMSSGGFMYPKIQVCSCRRARTDVGPSNTRHRRNTSSRLQL